MWRRDGVLPGSARNVYIYSFYYLLLDYYNLIYYWWLCMSILHCIGLHLLLLGSYYHPILYHCNLHVQLPSTGYSDYLAVSPEQRILIVLLLLYGWRSTRGTRKYSKVYPFYQTHLVGYDEWCCLDKNLYVCLLSNRTVVDDPNPLYTLAPTPTPSKVPNTGEQVL